MLLLFSIGNWPYIIPELIKGSDIFLSNYRETSFFNETLVQTDHPDELLKARLSHIDSRKSLLEQDLYDLSLGLDGR